MSINELETPASVDCAESFQPIKISRAARLISIASIPLIVIWPFIFFFRFAIPGQAFSYEIANDFQILYYPYKYYLFHYIEKGIWPLWSPFEAAGYPFYSNPFAAVFYPLNIPLYLIFKLIGDYPLFVHQLFSIFGLSIFGLGLYFWLSDMVANRRAVIVSVLIFVVSFRMGDIVRFPNAVHTAAWMPWILYSFNTLQVIKSRVLLHQVALFAFCVMLLTTGYLYYVFYCLFLIPPYFLILCYPQTRAAISKNILPQAVTLGRFVVRCMIPVVLACLICAPYLIKVSQLMKQTSDRHGGDYAYAVFGEFNGFDPLQTLGSLIFPPVSIAEGWYYFGICSVLLIALFVIASFWPGRADLKSSRQLCCLILLWVGVVSYITYGDHSILFKLLWKLMPGFDQLRCWGRLNIILLPLLALLLANSIDYFEGLLSSGQPGALRRRHALVTLLVIGASAGVVQLVFIKYGIVHNYWKTYFTVFHGQEYLFPLATLWTVGLIASILLVAPRNLGFASFYKAAVPALIVAASVCDLYPFTSKEWARAEEAVNQDVPKINVKEALEQAFTSPRQNGGATLFMRPPYFNAGYMRNWHFKRYTKLHRRVYNLSGFTVKNPRLELCFRKLLGLDVSKRLFYSNTIRFDDICDFIKHSDVIETEIKPKIDVTFYDGNTLRLQVTSPVRLFINFIDNWDPDWRATINDKDVEIFKLFGTFKSVAIEPGPSRVIFEYKPHLWSGGAQ